MTVIADYLLLSEGKAGVRATKTRLGHVARHLAAKQPNATVLQADEGFAERFRQWMLAETTQGGQRGNGVRQRSIGAVEGCLLQLAAAINSTPGQRALFKPLQMITVARSPRFRADIKKLAAMFDYCLRPDEPSEKMKALRISERANLLRYLRAAVATWARPDAIYEITDAQWHSDARVLDLNPPNRRQTRKYRPSVPIARQFVPHLDDLKGEWLSVASIRSAWDAMAVRLKLPRDGEAGEKLIRRSVSTIARKRIGEANWQQGKMMLGHVKASVSDIYALPDPANLGLVLGVTEGIIDDIEKLSPGAFARGGYRTVTALQIVEGGKN